EAITLADRLIFLSASPMQAIADVAVKLTAEQRQDDNAIENFRRELFIHHPTIHSLL
ncbi:MAG: ABC transporter ATP-binding protein, partial [Methylococcaceae bacterium]|nr:ABC transporter ATP-binding protein [Methylococcaceae bacterium]